MKHCKATLELWMRKLVKSRITWWDAIIEIKEIQSFLTMLWLRMQSIKTTIWPKMWLSSLHCCQFVLICVILSCTKVSEIDQAVKWCPIISLGLGGHNVTITMMDAHLKTLSVTVSSFFIEAPIYSPSLPLPSSVWWITLTWSLGKSIKKSGKAFFDRAIECWSSLSPRVVVFCDRLQPDLLLLKVFYLAPQLLQFS